MALKEDGWPVFVEALATGDSGQAIMNQEARGQAALVNSDTLPKDGVEALVPAGVIVGEEVDDLFVRVTLPAGWKKEPTDHSMWSKLVDDKGRERAAIFYKAAFYDRKARVSVNRRFDAAERSEWREAGRYEYPDTSPHYGVVLDCGVIIQRFGRVADATDRVGDTQLRAFEHQAEMWLGEHYPDWRNPHAYWD